MNESQDSQTDVPEIFPISSVTHTGLTELIRKTADLLDTTKLSDLEKPQDTTKQYDYKPADSSDFHISYDKEYESWVITGDKIERLFKMTNTEHDQSMLRFARQMHGMGIDDALRKAGAKDGDTVTILDFSFTYVE